MFRHPVAHVLSEFHYCADGLAFLNTHAQDPLFPPFPQWVSGWVELYRKGWHGNFTPGRGILIDTVLGLPPYTLEPRTVHDKDWPNIDGGGTIYHMTKIPYGCY